MAYSHEKTLALFSHEGTLYAVEQVEQSTGGPLSKSAPKFTWFLRREDRVAVEIENYTMAHVRSGLTQLEGRKTP